MASEIGPERSREVVLAPRLLIVVGLLLSAALSASGATCPTVCVIIPETVIINVIPRPVPDPAAETAIIHEFLSYGFHVVDQLQVKAIRLADPDLVKRAYAGDLTAIRSLSDRFVADVLVIGEAVSTVTVFQALRVPGQPQLQDGRARAEVRAIETRTGRILAAEARHTGGVDFTAELAGKKSLERAGVKVACPLATAIARAYPFPARCFDGCKVSPLTLGVLPFENASGFRFRAGDIGELLATATATAMSESGCRTAQVLAADFVVTGTITDAKELTTRTLKIPGLDWLWRGVTCWITVDVQVLDLNTGEFTAYEVTANATGVEVLGMRFGCSPRDIARAVGRKVAQQLGGLCRGG